MKIILLLIILFYSKLTQCYRKALEGYVVGGSYASIYQYPHSAFLEIRCNGSWICGSAILNQKILLTAAHCLIDCNIQTNGHVIHALAGHAHLHMSRMTRKVNHIIVHENYNLDDFMHDIGLASLEQPLPLTPTTKRIIIPIQFPDVKLCSLAGWGRINEETGETSLILKSIPQRIKSTFICELINATQPGMFCAGSIRETDEHPSAGDSGSALVTDDGQEIGLLSYRMVNIPTILAYTNTTYYYNWIEYHTKLLLCI